MHVASFCFANFYLLDLFDLIPSPFFFLFCSPLSFYCPFHFLIFFSFFNFWDDFLAAMLSQFLNYILPFIFFLLPVPLLSATSPDAAERYKVFPVCKRQCSPGYVLNWEDDSCLKMTSFLSPPRKVVWRFIKDLAGILSPLLQCFIHLLSNKHGKEHTDSWPSLLSSLQLSLSLCVPRQEQT